MKQRKALTLRTRTKSVSGKFQADIEPVDVLGIDEIVKIAKSGEGVAVYFH